MVYELMHFKHGDASTMVHSMDIPWYFVYRKSFMFESVMEDLQKVNIFAGIYNVQIVSSKPPLKQENFLNFTFVAPEPLHC